MPTISTPAFTERASPAGRSLRTACGPARRRRLRARVAPARSSSHGRSRGAPRVGLRPRSPRPARAPGPATRPGPVPSDLDHAHALAGEARDGRARSGDTADDARDVGERLRGVAAGHGEERTGEQHPRRPAAASNRRKAHLGRADIPHGGHRRHCCPARGRGRADRSARGEASRRRDPPASAPRPRRRPGSRRRRSGHLGRPRRRSPAPAPSKTRFAVTTRSPSTRSLPPQPASAAATTTRAASIFIRRLAE